MTNNLDCIYFLSCSGCQIEKDLLNPPALKTIFEFLETLENPPTLKTFHGPIHNYRLKSKLAIRGSFHNPLIGLFKENSHEVFDIPECRVHHPLINEAALILRGLITEFEVFPYNESRLTGILRYVQFFVDPATDKVQICLVLNQKNLFPSLMPFLEALSSYEKLHSLWVNFQPEKTNTIFGKNFQRISGEEFLKIALLGKEFYFHPACFSQANFPLFEKLVDSLKNKIQPGSKVIELYAGMGLIGISVAEESREVLLYEMNPFSESSFYKTKEGLSSEIQKKLQFFTQDISKNFQFGDAEVLIVDPPRKGLSKELIEALKSDNNLKQLIYVSCGVNSFCRDTKALLENWELKSIEAYVLFPGTDQVEVLGVFENGDKSL